jgi:uncharacterized protein
VIHLNLIVSTRKNQKNQPLKVMPDRIILFTRFPRAGKVKTRLISVLGPEGACILQQKMTERVLKQLRAYSALYPASLEIRFDGGHLKAMKDWLGADLFFCAQGAGDLGDRMNEAFKEAFFSGAGKVVVVGSDCPGLTPQILGKAFQGLDRYSLVLGPSRDGGYYLIGSDRDISPLFAGMPWGSEGVFDKTYAKARQLGLKVLLVDLLDDIDRPDDLPVWEKFEAVQSETKSASKLSIIIPTLNEAAQLTATLGKIPKTPHLEVIIVDGGSGDRTRELAASWGTRVISSPRGRARQMNLGARMAEGEFLLFLHADTHLPERFDIPVVQILSRPDVSAGAFQLKFDPPLKGLKIIERIANWRARIFQLPYGDQAIFLRADRFRDLGGFSEIPIMEDVDLILRSRRKGRILIAPLPVMTSSRRWKNSGVWKTSLKNQLALWSFLAGFSPDRIARWYSHGPPSPE